MFISKHNRFHSLIKSSRLIKLKPAQTNPPRFWANTLNFRPPRTPNQIPGFILNSKHHDGVNPNLTSMTIMRASKPLIDLTKWGHITLSVNRSLHHISVPVPSPGFKHSPNTDRPSNTAWVLNTVCSLNTACAFNTACALKTACASSTDCAPS